jgi:hypothetical protein
MEKVPGSGRPRSKSFSQATAPDGPDDDAPLPAPEPGACAGSGEGDGPSANGISSVAAWRDALGIPAADKPVLASDVHGASAAAWPTVPVLSRKAGAGTSVLAPTAVGSDANAGSEPRAAGRSTEGSKTPGSAAGNGVSPVTRSVTGCTTGSRMGTAVTSGGTATSTSPATVPSVAAATGTATAETAPEGTTLFTTGTAATS